MDPRFFHFRQRAPHISNSPTGCQRVPINSVSARMAEAPKNGASPAGTDRDAVATRRLITREMGEFLPSSPNLRSDDSSSRTN